jgi:hypothetical protein
MNIFLIFLPLTLNYYCNNNKCDYKSEICDIYYTIFLLIELILALIICQDHRAKQELIIATIFLLENLKDISHNKYILYEKTNFSFEECKICFNTKSNIKTKCDHDYCFQCFSLYYLEKYNNINCVFCRNKLFNENGITLLTNDDNLLINK